MCLSLSPISDSLKGETQPQDLQINTPKSHLHPTPSLAPTAWGTRLEQGAAFQTEGGRARITRGCGSGTRAPTLQ